MLTYRGFFNKTRMIEAARNYISVYANRGKKDECEVPFQSEDRTQKGYVQFALLAGFWVFVRVRKARGIDRKRK